LNINEDYNEGFENFFSNCDFANLSIKKDPEGT